MMLQNTGAVLSIAFVLAIVTRAVPKDVIFKIFSGLASREARPSLRVYRTVFLRERQLRYSAVSSHQYDG
jgi:hypothetical protein